MVDFGAEYRIRVGRKRTAGVAAWESELYDLVFALICCSSQDFEGMRQHANVADKV